MTRQCYPRKVYTVPVGQFHESIARGSVVTLMRKYGLDHQARLLNLVPNEKTDEPHPFNHRHYTKDQLWAIVDVARDRVQREIASWR